MRFFFMTVVPAIIAGIGSYMLFDGNISVALGNTVFFFFLGMLIWAS